jgi:aldose 1-epimerase
VSTRRDADRPRVRREAWGRTADGTSVERLTLVNRHGLVARVATLGATLTELQVPDRDGRLADVVLGFDAASSYERPGPYFGATIGRVANRIAGARFTLDGTEYTLAANEGPHHLHGGRRGFDKAVWMAEVDAAANAVSFSYTSPAGDEGYPGRLDASVRYRLDDEDVLHVEHRARTDAPTLVNLTNHTYWNLRGSGDVLDHVLRLDASRYCETDEAAIPTGRLPSVAGTPFDFRTPRRVRPAPGGPREGYDHTFVLADRRRASPAPAGELSEPASGRRLRLETTEPGVQLYTGQHLASVPGKGGAVYGPHAGLCLETQVFPDAVHHAAFPSVVLRPDEPYVHVTRYAFSVTA